MLQSVNLAMDGNLSDALNDGLWFGASIYSAIYCRLNLQAFALSVIQLSKRICVIMIKRCSIVQFLKFHSFNTESLALNPY